MTYDGFYYATQIDEKKGFGWQTCWYHPGFTLEDAQKEAARVCRKRKCKFRIIRVDTKVTIIQPENKNNNLKKPSSVF
jgi:hypothetical protein